MANIHTINRHKLAKLRRERQTQAELSGAPQATPAKSVMRHTPKA
jgi:hypothetical protein